MKRKILSILLIVALILPCIASAEQKKAKPNPPYALARGFANVLTCWMEMPRGLIYENARIPIIGFFTGTVKGGFLTIYRAVAGTIDIAAMGLTKEGLYFKDVPDFVWDADWIPACGEDMVDSKNLEYSSCTTCGNKKSLANAKRCARKNKKRPCNFYRKKQKRRYRQALPPNAPTSTSDNWGAQKRNTQGSTCFVQVREKQLAPFALYADADADAKEEAKILQMEQQVADIEQRAAMYQ